MKEKKQTLKKTAFIIGLLLQVYLTLPLFSRQSIGFFQHNRWTSEDGLPMNSVMSIAQTPDGYLWVGTESGLTRFDGVAFNVFNRTGTPVFPGSIITSLAVDRTGTLWITTRGDGVFRYSNGTFSSVSEDTGCISDEAWSVTQSTDHSIWIGSRTGICRINDGKPANVPLPGNLSTQTVARLLEDRNGHIWAGTKGDGLVLIKKRRKNFEAEHIGLTGMEITTLFEDRKGDIWVGTVGNGLFRFRGNRRWSYTTADGLSANNIGCLYEDRFGNLWIGTDGGGINILPAKGRENHRVWPFQDQEEISSRTIYAFFQDLEGTLWIGTGGGGLKNIRETKITTYTTKHGLSYNFVYGAFQDGSGRVWTGTKGYGLNYFKDNRFQTLTTRDGLSSDFAVTMAEDRNGALWFGTLGAGVNRWLNGRFDSFTFPGGPRANTFRAVYADPEGTVLAGAINGVIYQLREKTFHQAVDVKFRINAFLKDSFGNLWVATFGSGICRLDLKNGNFEVFNNRQGLSHNLVSCIHQDAVQKDVLWVGTVNGLNRFKDGVFKPLFSKDGLPDDTAYWILEDHKNDFWISSNRGIYCLNREEVDAFFNGTLQRVEPKVYAKEAGMRSIECNGGNHPGGWKSRDGKLWFPTTHGISVIDPKNIPVNNIPPPVMIKKITVDGRNYPMDSMDKEKPLVIPPGKHNIEINYTALSFVVPGKIRFRYKMEGFDSQWNKTAPDAERTVYYTNIPPGKFRFRVIACNSDGVWNNTGASVILQLETKFYQTTAFKIILPLLLILVGLPVYFYWKRKRYNHKPPQKQRARITSLNPEETETHIRKLHYLLEMEKVYKQPDISIKTLSSKLLLSSRCLSELINDELKMNFYEFITDYRIKEAKRILKNPKTRNNSIIHIAYDVGYNSKSAFNRAFKKITGMTPSEFRKKEG